MDIFCCYFSFSSIKCWSFIIRFCLNSYRWSMFKPFESTRSMFKDQSCDVAGVVWNISHGQVNSRTFPFSFLFLYLWDGDVISGVWARLSGAITAETSLRCVIKDHRRFHVAVSQGSTGPWGSRVLWTPRCRFVARGPGVIGGLEVMVNPPLSAACMQGDTVLPAACSLVFPRRLRAAGGGIAWAQCVRVRRSRRVCVSIEGDPCKKEGMGGRGGLPIYIGSHTRGNEVTSKRLCSWIVKGAGSLPCMSWQAGSGNKHIPTSRSLQPIVAFSRTKR